MLCLLCKQFKDIVEIGKRNQASTAHYMTDYLIKRLELPFQPKYPVRYTLST